jgi:hypothetical protein
MKLTQGKAMTMAMTCHDLLIIEEVVPSSSFAGKSTSEGKHHSMYYHLPCLGVSLSQGRIKKCRDQG